MNDEQQFVTLSTVEIPADIQPQSLLPGTSASFEQPTVPGETTVIIVQEVTSEIADSKTTPEVREKRKYTRKAKTGDEEGDESKIKCTMCSFASPHAGHMRRHVEKKHLNVKPRVITEHKCEHCDKTFKDLFHLNNHRNLHVGAKPFQCAQCDLSFGSKGELDRHSKYKHTMERPQQCPHCEYATVELSKLKRHMRVHTDERPYLCGFCDYASRDTFRLKRHMRIHTGEKPYQCPHCPMNFAQSNTLKTHVKTRHEKHEKEPDEEEGVEAKSSPERRRRSKRTIHSAKSEPLVVDDDTTDEEIDQEEPKSKRKKRSSTTEETGNTTDSQIPLSSLNTNQPVVQLDEEGWFVCSECSMRFLTKELMEEHYVKHTGERPFECDKCNMKFSHRFALRAHKQSHDAEHSQRVRQSLRQASNAVKRSKSAAENEINTSANSENLQAVDDAIESARGNTTSDKSALAFSKPPSEYKIEVQASTEEKIVSCDDEMPSEQDQECSDELVKEMSASISSEIDDECLSRPISPIVSPASFMDTSDVVFNDSFDLDIVESVKQTLEELVAKIEAELIVEKLPSSEAKTVIGDDDIEIIEEKKPDTSKPTRPIKANNLNRRARLMPQPQAIEPFRISQGHTAKPLLSHPTRINNSQVISATPIIATPIMNNSTGNGIYVLPSGVNSVTPITPITPITPLGTSCMPILGNQFGTSVIPIGGPISVPIGSSSSVSSPYQFGQMPTVIPLGTSMAMPIMGNASNQVTVIPISSSQQPMVTAIAQPINNNLRSTVPGHKPSLSRVVANTRSNDKNDIIVLDGAWGNTKPKQDGQKKSDGTNKALRGSYPILASQISSIEPINASNKTNLLHQLPFNDQKRVESLATRVTPIAAPLLAQKVTIIPAQPIGSPSNTTFTNSKILTALTGDCHLLSDRPSLSKPSSPDKIKPKDSQPVVTKPSQSVAQSSSPVQNKAQSEQKEDVIEIVTPLENNKTLEEIKPIDQETKYLIERKIQEEEADITTHSSLISDDASFDKSISLKMEEESKCTEIVEDRAEETRPDDSQTSVALSTSLVTEEEQSIVKSSETKKNGKKRAVSHSPSPSKSPKTPQKSPAAVKVKVNSSSKRLNYEHLYGSSPQDRSINKTIELMKKNNAEKADAAAENKNLPEQMTFKKGMRKRLIQHTENSFVIMDKNNEALKRIRKSSSVETTDAKVTDEEIRELEAKNESDKSIEEIEKKVDESEDENKGEKRRGHQLGRLKRTNDDLSSDGVCKICQRSFSNMMGLDRHMKETHRMVPRNRKAYNTFYMGESFLSVLDATATLVSPTKKQTETLTATEARCKETVSETIAKPGEEGLDGDCCPFFDINSKYAQTQLALQPTTPIKPAVTKKTTAPAKKSSSSPSKAKAPPKPVKTALEKRSSHLAYETRSGRQEQQVVIEIDDEDDKTPIKAKKSPAKKGKTLTKSPQHGSLDRFVKRK